MGYSTDFHGSFKLNKPLAPEHAAYLRAFAETRRMKRDASVTEERPDPVRVAAGLPVGKDGGYFVGEGGVAGQGEGGFGVLPKGVLDFNREPTEQPGLWCQWVPNEDGTEIEWDGGEKFYHYVDWLDYLIEHFLSPWGYTLEGEVEWRGEDWEDTGTISVSGNVVEVST